MEEKFQIERNMGKMNSFGPVGERKTVMMQVSVKVNEATNYGCYELYDIESAGDQFYAEGGLWFKEKNLIDYDGIYALPDFIVEKLRDNGFIVPNSMVE